MFSRSIRIADICDRARDGVKFVIILPRENPWLLAQHPGSCQAITTRNTAKGGLVRLFFYPPSYPSCRSIPSHKATDWPLRS